MRRLFAKGGEMGALMNSIDWSQTPVGPIESWPTSLETALSMILQSQHPMFIWWGDELIQFYNDAYLPLLGVTKHPAAMGQRGRESFGEVWDVLGPMVDTVRAGGSTFIEDGFLMLDRYGFREECYFNYGFSPIRGAPGEPGGILVVCSESTGPVLSQRRLETLNTLAVTSRSARTMTQAIELATSVIEEAAADLPFGLVYVIGPDGEQICKGHVGIAADHPAASNEALGVWLQASEASSTVEVDIEGLFDVPLPGGPWDETPRNAFVVPLGEIHDKGSRGYFIAGASPCLRLDDAYRTFARLVGNHFGGTLTSVRELERERDRAEALAALDRAKGAFFSNVSHELRTPLTLLLGPLEAATHGERIADETAHMMNRQALRLLRMVNTLLDFSQLEAGRAAPQLSATRIDLATREVAAGFETLVTKAGVGFVVECEEMPEAIEVDREMWEKIVLNLLSNAFKFTHTGSVRVRLARVGADVRLQVSDTGVGIDAEVLGRVFERFYRAEGQGGRSHEGTGIGLSLVKELAQLLGGDASIESTVGVGTQVTVRIPRSVANAPEASFAEAPSKSARAYAAEAELWLATEERSAPQQTDAARAVVVVADDNADMRRYLVRLLENRWTVHAASDGLAALELVKEYKPEVLVTDVMMPNLDGFELLERIRDDESHRDTSVVMLSAQVGEDSRADSLDAGADDYITKPFIENELIARIAAQIEIVRLRRRVEMERQHLQSALMQAPVPIAMLTGEPLVYDLANSEYETMVGRKVLGLSIDQAFPEIPVDSPAKQLVREVYRTGVPWTAEEYNIPIDRGNGVEESFFRLTCQPMRAPTGEITGVISVAVEVTPQVMAKRSLEALAERESLARAEAEAANRSKDEFLAMLGHELRNPLSPIVSALQLLDDSGVRARELDIIRRQTEHLVCLVDDLLDVSRIAGGKIEIRAQRTEIAPVIERGIEVARPLLEERRQTLELDVPATGLHVAVDENRIAQVVSNLLTNAAKYSDMDSTIRLVARREDHEVRVAVIDEGIGLAPEMQSIVFDAFHQQQQALDRSRGGLGLGLAIVRNLVHLHGGQVGVKSDGEGCGSEFYFVLPVVKSHRPAADDEKEGHGSKDAPSEGTRIMVVDDNVDAASMMADLLSMRGFEVAVAHDGPSALVLAKSFRPDIGVLDIGLPAMDGYELARRLRALPDWTEQRRLIALTGYGQPSDRKRSAEAGFAVHLVKPVSLKALEEALRGV